MVKRRSPRNAPVEMEIIARLRKDADRIRRLAQVFPGRAEPIVFDIIEQPVFSPIIPVYIRTEPIPVVSRRAMACIYEAIFI